jgi:arylsulfatase A-like enzyme
MMLSACLALAAALLPQGTPVKPRLVVLIVVDQLIPEQLQRLEPRLSGGLRRFLDEGVVFWNATLDYSCTETGPGHASVATGRYPAHNGIVGNLFHDREQHRNVYCVGDPSTLALSASGPVPGAPSMSPANLVGPTLGELLRAAQPGSHTVAIAGKDRSAVLMGGHGAEVALWWDYRAGGFGSSTAYGEDLPECAAIWNEAWVDRALGWSWEPLDAEGLARLGTQPDDRPGEPGRGGTFPHVLPQDRASLAGAVFSTPLIDFFTLELATLAIDAHELGSDDTVDFLAVGLSGCDVVGHGYGPYSAEVTDLLLRDDRDLGRFLEGLDAVVGEGRWLACLTSDHGVLELPEMLRATGVDAHRIGLPELAAILELGTQALKEAYGEQAPTLQPAENGFFFDPATLGDTDVVEARGVVAKAVVASPWVAEAYTLDQLEGPAADGFLLLYQRATHPGRGPDVVVRFEPWTIVNFPTGTSHGSPYPYDRRIPLAFLGAGLEPARRHDSASNVDVVPTVLSELGLALPADLDGQVLSLR